MSDDTVPVIDIGPFLAGDPAGRKAIPQAIARACEGIGFFTIVGHGVDRDLILAATTSARQFFDLPTAEKAMVRSPDPALSRGYRGIGNEGLAGTRAGQTPPDLKEVFHLGPPDFPHDAYHTAPEARPHFVDDVWPRSPASFRTDITAYYRAVEKLGADIMRMFALALDLPEDFFADKIDRHISALRIINYPEQPQAPLPGQLRAGAHSDYGTLTILLGENQPGSLQVKPRSGDWMDVVIPAGVLRHQHRRPDDAMDQRSLGVDVASGGEPARAGRRRGAPPVAGLLPSSELRRRGRLHSDLRRRGPSAALPAGQGRAVPQRQVRPGHHQADGRVTASVTFILVHGAWQGAWAWETIVPRLEAAGHRAIAVDLPGNGHDETPPADVDVNLYAQHLASIIDGVDGPVVLVGHSMGGTAVAQACELRPERVALAIYLAAFLLPDGMSVMMFYDRYLEPWMRGATTRVTHSPDGLLSTIDPTSAVEVFYHQADPAAAAAAARRLDAAARGRPSLEAQPVAGALRTGARASTSRRPQDRSVHLPLQRRMQQMTPCRAVLSLDTDHAPQLVRPGGVDRASA